MQKFSLQNEAYEILGHGKFDAAGTFSISSTLRLSQELSEGLILKKPKLKLLASRGGSLELPVKIIKKDKVIVIPDVSGLTKNAIRATAQEAVKRNIDKLDKIQQGLGDAINSLFK